MATYDGNPDWANPGSSATASAPTSSAAPAGGAGGNATTFSTPGPKKNCIQRFLSILVIGLCAMMMTVGVFGLIDFNWANVSNYADAFVAIYMLLFAALLATYEIMWWQSIPVINKSLRKNFGFLYGVRGKSLFIIFIAFLNFGLQNEVRVKGLSLATGISFFAVACLHLFLYFWRPEKFGTYQAPTAGLTDNSPV